MAIFEGRHPYLNPEPPTLPRYLGPLYEYPHSSEPPRCSVIGGVHIDAGYVFADWCGGDVWVLNDSATAVELIDHVPSPNAITRFSGRLYAVSNLGGLFRLEP
jgi:hypothetical protein